VLFGSDYPLDDPRLALDAERSLGSDDNELRAILHDNAAALLAGTS
jgi:predicted TIM-barrel fold metal-dependent hydrolase